MVPQASHRRLARVLEVDRRRFNEAYRQQARRTPSRAVDEQLCARIHRLIQEHPTFGYRRIWALLRFREGIGVNRKKVQRIMQIRGWQCTNRKATPRPRVRKSRSRARASNERWAMEIAIS